jgi:hypothetical protein
MSGSNGSLVSAIKMKAKYAVLVVAIMPVYILGRNAETEVAYFEARVFNKPF